MKKLSCRLGRHTWTKVVEQGESYKLCTACGKSTSPGYAAAPGATTIDHLRAEASGPGRDADAVGGDF
jgi:hypothetical protein